MGGWIEEKQAVGMRCCKLLGVEGRGEEGGWNEVLYAWGGWVGGWVYLVDDLLVASLGGVVSEDFG